MAVNVKIYSPNIGINTLNMNKDGQNVDFKKYISTDIYVDTYNK